MTFAVHHFTPPNGPVLNVAKRGAGIKVLMQHGLCGAASQPQEIFPFELPAQCHTLECRGHGLSGEGDVATYSIAQFTDDCVEYLTHNFSEPVIVGGISMGAAIALRLAVTRPELVSGVILARPAWSLASNPPNMQPNAEVGNLLSCNSAEIAETLFREGGTYKQLLIDAPDNLASLLGFFKRLPQHVTSALLQRISADGPGVTVADVKRLTVPTLIIGHDLDVIHPYALAQELAALIPHAQLHKITPKATEKSTYISDFQTALRNFLRGFI